MEFLSIISSKRLLDNLWAAIIIVTPRDLTRPVELKFVLLNPDVRSYPVCDGLTFGDIDGKVLVWNSSNRPTRRFLYFRFAKTFFLHAEKEDWDFKSKVSSVTTWVSPSRPDGYLRSSILRTLAKRILNGDTCPFELMQGCSEDSPSSPDDPIKNKSVGNYIEGMVSMYIEDPAEMKGDETEDDEDVGEWV